MALLITGATLQYMDIVPDSRNPGSEDMSSPGAKVHIVAMDGEAPRNVVLELTETDDIGGLFVFEGEGVMDDADRIFSGVYDSVTGEGHLAVA